MSRDHPSPPPQPLYGSFEQRGLHMPSYPQHEEEDSGSGSELNSPPHLIITEPEDQEPCSPTSPPCLPLSVDMNPEVSPKETIFGSDTEECHSLDVEEDLYFKSLVDNFVGALADVIKCALSNDEIDKLERDFNQSDKCANIALKHYNDAKKNKVKYELIRAISSCSIMERRGCYFHVNFIAKGDQHNSKEELFFAEIFSACSAPRGTYVTTCMLSLEGLKKVGGLCESKYDNIFSVKGLPVDPKNCYACGNEVKHPKEGEQYETGHVAISDYYHG